MLIRHDIVTLFPYIRLLHKRAYSVKQEHLLRIESSTNILWALLRKFLACTDLSRVAGGKQNARKNLFIRAESVTGPPRDFHEEWIGVMNTLTD